MLARILGAKNGCRVWTGEWDLVRAEAQEAAELAEEIGDSFRGLSAKVDLAMLAGQRGDHESAETLALKRSSLVKGVPSCSAPVNMRAGSGSPRGPA
ncbi:hypothetical protein [Streptomyces sp. NPDC002573]|uniref:hypothetical protein n=1 Tax=Streptomyces sp. NPDC002573 TaxID=3364651 RepID=UPI0036BFCD52